MVMGRTTLRASRNPVCITEACASQVLTHSADTAKVKPAARDLPASEHKSCSHDGQPRQGLYQLLTGAWQQRCSHTEQPSLRGVRQDEVPLPESFWSEISNSLHGFSHLPP